MVRQPFQMPIQHKLHNAISSEAVDSSNHIQDRPEVLKRCVQLTRR